MPPLCCHVVEISALRQSSMYMNSDTYAKTVGELREMFSWITKLGKAKKRVCTLVSKKKTCLMGYRPLSLRWEGSNCWNLAHESAAWFPHGENSSSITERYVSQKSTYPRQVGSELTTLESDHAVLRDTYLKVNTFTTVGSWTSICCFSLYWSNHALQAQKLTSSEF